MSAGTFPEKRATIRLKRYWMSLRQSESGPYFADFRPALNPIRWDDCCLVCWSGDSGPAIEHFGDGYRGVFGLSPQPAELVDPNARFARLFGDLGEARRARAAVEVDGRDDQGRRAILYRSMLLPFADLHGQPAYVLAAFTCTEIRGHASADLPRIVG